MWCLAVVPCQLQNDVILMLRGHAPWHQGNSSGGQLLLEACNGTAYPG